MKKAVADIKGNGTYPSNKCLNVCEMVSTLSGEQEYPMTLLAFAGYHLQRDMVTYLLSQKAGMFGVVLRRKGGCALSCDFYEYYTVIKLNGLGILHANLDIIKRLYFVCLKVIYCILRGQVKGTACSVLIIQYRTRCMCVPSMHL